MSQIYVELIIQNAFDGADLIVDSVSLALVPSSDEKVTNGGFETVEEGVPTGWTLDPACSSETTVVLAGSAALRIEANTDGTARQVITVGAGPSSGSPHYSLSVAMVAQRISLAGFSGRGLAYLRDVNTGRWLAAGGASWELVPEPVLTFEGIGVEDWTTLSLADFQPIAPPPGHHPLLPPYEVPVETSNGTEMTPAVAGLMRAGISRAGFYPDDCQDVEVVVMSETAPGIFEETERKVVGQKYAFDELIAGKE